MPTTRQKKNKTQTEQTARRSSKKSDSRRTGPKPTKKVARSKASRKSKPPQRRRKVVKTKSPVGKPDKAPSGEKKLRKKKKKKSRKRAKRPPPTPSELRYIFRALRNFVDDLECIRELAIEVPPFLAEKLSRGTKRLQRILGELKGDKYELKSDLARREVLETVRDLNRTSRGNQMFRENSVIGIITRFEVLSTSIATAYFTVNRGALATKTKSITYEELLEYASIEEAVGNLLHRELFSLSKESHEDRLLYLDEKLKLGLKESFADWGRFAEISARRNLFVHAGGRVNPAYVRVVSRHFPKDAAELNDGAYLGASGEYITEAHDCVFSAGVQAALGAARRLHSSELQAIDELANSIGYDLLVESNWPLAEKIFAYLSSLGSKWTSSDAFRRMFLINRCIALKHLGELNQMQKILNSVDWSSCGRVYALALAVLNDDYDSAKKLMISTTDADVDEDGFRHWPLFNDFRDKASFAAAFEERFGKEYQPEVSKEEELDKLNQKREASYLRMIHGGEESLSKRTL